jgi:hypothetical protein
MRVVVHSAAIQDRDGAGLVLDKDTPPLPVARTDLGRWRLQCLARRCRGGESAPAAPGDCQTERRRKGLRGAAAPLGGRAHLLWFGRNRRLAKDFENLAETLATFVTLACIQLALLRLARVAALTVGRIAPTVVLASGCCRIKIAALPRTTWMDRSAP